MSETRRLIDSERRSWENGFFGREVPVPPPPKAILETLRVASGEGFTTLEAHVFPFRPVFPSRKVALQPDDKYPGWKIKPSDLFWDWVKAGKLSRDAARFPGPYWVIVDGSDRLKYDGGRQLYTDDRLGQELARLREEGKIATSGYSPEVPPASRCAVSMKEVDRVIKPLVAGILRLEKYQGNMVKSRIPYAREFNILGNAFYPQWGDEPLIWELFEDRYDRSGCFYGDLSCSPGNLVFTSHWYGQKDPFTSFRPLIEFPLGSY